MKIVLLNYRFFVSGGPERYLFNVMDLLEAHGHQVIPFSFAYSNSRPTAYADDFADPPGGPEAAWYKDLKQDWRTNLRMFGKLIYNFDAKRRLKNLLKREKVDLVYALQMVNTLYPSVVDACVEEGVPLVHRLSDFQYLCGNYKFYRDGKICEDCQTGGYYHCVVHRCMKDSLAVSGLRVLTMYLNRWRGAHKKIAAFITPSRILRQKMLEGGFPDELLHHVPTFTPGVHDEETGPGDLFLYAGAIEPCKGVFELVEAYAALAPHQQLPLVFAGYSLGDTESRLREKVVQLGLGDRVEWLGFQSEKELSTLYQRARAVLVPTLWYENMPNVVLEAMAHGRAVIGTRLGGVAEMVEHEETGLLTEPGNVNELCRSLARLADDPETASRFGRGGRLRCQETFGPEAHYARLSGIFDQVLNQC
jgi:glycosyltransferase involved in cell wall biosynthesis